MGKRGYLEFLLRRQKGRKFESGFILVSYQVEKFRMDSDKKNH
jgi:hypothetical protein